MTARRRTQLALVIVVMAAWFLLLGPSSFGGPAAYILVSGVSMQPTLYTGDLAVLYRQTSYAKGDVVGYQADGGVVIHRIVGGSAEEGFQMRGDNKDSNDPWYPRPKDILGRMWLSIPRAGRALANMRQPVTVAALGGLAALLWLDEPKKAIRRHGRRLKSQLANGVAQTVGGATDLLTIIAMVTLALVAIGGYGWLQPLEKTQVVQQTLYRHTATFQYTVHTAPSILYPGDRIGPIGPANAAAAPPILTPLANSIDLDFAYLLAGAQSPRLNGELSIALHIQSGQDWAKTETLLALTPFAGTATSTRVTIDLAKVQSVIKTVEQETGGYNPGSYEIEVAPLVRVTGQLGAQAVNDVYTPTLKFSLAGQRLVADTDLARSEDRTVAVTTRQPNTVGAFGFTVPVRTLRVLGIAGGVTGLVVTSLLVAVVFGGLGLDEVGKVRARYGAMLVSVAASNFEGSQRIEVATIEDLARVAQRAGGVICYEARHNWHLFFVPDGPVIYTYRVSERREDT